MSNSEEVHLGEMAIKITPEAFHATHDAARAVQKIVQGGSLEQVSLDKIHGFLKKLEAGAALSAAETGPDCFCAPSYYDSIKRVKAAIESKEAQVSLVEVDSGTCPYCGCKVHSAEEEMSHMEVVHSDIIAERMKAFESLRGYGE